MIRYLGCETAREMLEAFRDGELAVVDQVALESHLRWCTTCAAHVDDLNVIGSGIRTGSPAFACEDERALELIQSDVLARIGAERDQSWRTWVSDLFEDRRLLWPALGASVAVFICLCFALSVLQFATAERPDSLAAMIQTLDPGSDRNPLRHDPLVAVPRALDDSAAFDRMRSDDVTFAVATIVTREGKIAGYELLDKHTAGPSGDVEALLHAVRESRFEPAQAVDGRPVAVNMVWLFAFTTAERDVQLEELLKGAPHVQPAHAVPARVAPPSADPVKPVEEPRPTQRSSTGLSSTTA